jgi:hypothetical protein
MVVPGLYKIAYEYKVSINTVSWVMVGSTSLSIGVIIFFVAAAATSWGNRGLYFIGTSGLLISCIWAYFSRVRNIVSVDISLLSSCSELPIFGGGKNISGACIRAFRNPYDTHHL